MHERDVYEALGRYLDAAARLTAAGSHADAALVSEAVYAKLAYQNLLDAYLLGLRVSGRRTRESLELALAAVSTSSTNDGRR